MSRLTLGCDPGECTGLAWGVDRELVACGAAAPGDVLWTPDAIAGRTFSEPSIAVFELPRFYPIKVYGSHKKATAIGNSLIREAVSLGEWKNQARKLGYTLQEEFPRTWKGTLNKDAMCRHIISRLTPAERKMVSRTLKESKLAKSKTHNVLDAIGIFFWSVGRL